MLCLESAAPEVVQSGSSEPRANCWQSSKLDFSMAPTDELAKHVLFGFASFPAITAEPASLVIGA